jgi:hypothetical protein
LLVAGATLLGGMLPEAQATAGVAAYGSAAVVTQPDELSGLDTRANDSFGWSVSVSGNAIVVGAPGHGAGRAYLFTPAGSGWHQAAELEGPGTNVNDSFGTAVAIAGNTVVVGASGSGRAYVFTKTVSGWRETASLAGHGLTSEGFGFSVALSGPTLVVGSMDSASVFTEAVSGWHEAAVLRGSDTVRGDGFGHEVAISGSTVVVGAAGHAKLMGRVYVFAKKGAGWGQVAELEGSGTVPGEAFGNAVAVDANTIAANTAIGQLLTLPKTYLFTRGLTGWQQTAELTSPTGLGGGLAISGTALVAGSIAAADVFTNTSAGWRETTELKGADTVEQDDFGSSVAMSEGTVVVGATFRASDAGRVYVFRLR